MEVGFSVCRRTWDDALAKGNGRRHNDPGTPHIILPVRLSQVALAG